MTTRSTEDGRVYCCDTRNPGSVVYTIEWVAGRGARGSCALRRKKKKKHLAQPRSTHTSSAHTSAVSAVTQSHFLPGLLVTGSNDRSIKIWDVSSGQPKHIHTRNMDVVCEGGWASCLVWLNPSQSAVHLLRLFPPQGAVYTTLFSPDSPFVVSVGGREGGLKVLDLEDIGPGVFVLCVYVLLQKG